MRRLWLFGLEGRESLIAVLTMGVTTAALRVVLGDASVVANAVGLVTLAYAVVLGAMFVWLSIRLMDLHS